MPVILKDCRAEGCGVGLKVTGVVDLQVDGFAAKNCNEAIVIEESDAPKPEASSRLKLAKDFLMQTASSAAAGLITG
ncbi:hypothetical protein C7W88_06780 [Novosphingobium sp. THN1]|nr:hypothetical protein C7W88_06780 [Novosphingobium sp. THN1]